MTITELCSRPPEIRRFGLAATAGTARHDGHVAFDLSAVTFRGGAPADRKAVAESIEQLLESWCAL